MKTAVCRIWVFGVVGACTFLSAGCAKIDVRAEEIPVYKQDSPASSPGAAAGAEAEVAPAQPLPAEQAQPVTPVAEAEASPAAAGASEAPAASEEGSPSESPKVEVVQPATAPGTLQVSPGLAQVIKLAQAGVGEDVMLAYIANSTNLYDLGTDQIVYLNDLGVSSEVIRTLLEKDNSPEAMAQRAAAEAASPLPAGVALTTPAPDIYYTQAQGAETAEAAPAPEEMGVAVSPVPVPQETTVDYVTANQSVEGSAAPFYDALAPYGNWIYVDGYGLCWQPTVAVVNNQWRPYADQGRWLWTDAGWYWYSGYSWGWAPFHYGRWFQAPSCGWVWYPDTLWGPSWVTWRYSNAYCGWAPLPPYTGWSAGLGLVYRGDSVHVGFGFGFGYSCYTFIPWSYFCHPTPYHHYVHGYHRSIVYKDTRPINHYARGERGLVNEGMGYREAVRRSRGDIDRVAIRPEAGPASVGGRPERLVQDGASLAVTRPRLPAARSASGSAAAGGGATSNVRPIPQSASTFSRPSSGRMGSGAGGGTAAVRPGTSGSSPATLSSPSPARSSSAGPAISRSSVGSTVSKPTARPATTSRAPVNTQTLSRSRVITRGGGGGGSEVTIVRQSRPSFSQPSSTLSSPTPSSTTPSRSRSFSSGSSSVYRRPTVSSPAGSGSVRVYSPPQRSVAPVPATPSAAPSYRSPSPAPTPRVSPPSRSVPRSVSPSSAPSIRSVPGPSSSFSRSRPSSVVSGGSFSRRPTPSIAAPAVRQAPTLAPSGRSGSPSSRSRGR